MERLVFDIETDDIKANQIWMIGIHNLETGDYNDYCQDDVCYGLDRLSKAEVVIGHNIKGFDIPVMRKLTEGIVDIPKAKSIDTLEISRLLFPNLKSHALRSWGEIFQFPKGEWKDFSRYSEEMRSYMRRDVDLTVRLYEFLMSQIDGRS